MVEFAVGTDGNTIDVWVSKKHMTFDEAKRMRDQLTDALMQYKCHDIEGRKDLQWARTAQEQEGYEIIMAAAAQLR